jgi:DNA (cytosine-5)-methyltransferase 3A
VEDVIKGGIGMYDNISVLSLFDGMSCGRIALERLGINVAEYHASEIDKWAIKVTQRNYPDTRQIGDVKAVDGTEYGDFDLLIGGSPCQGFSFAGKKLAFDDERSALFFEYVRVLREMKPTWFLLENVVMKKEYQDIITAELGVEPILINSALVSAQNRRRLYWTNIPNVGQPQDKGIVLRDILCWDKEAMSKVLSIKGDNLVAFKQNYVQWDATGKGHGSQDQRAYYLDGKHGALPSNGGASKVKVYMGNYTYRKLTPLECERLQTVPDNYTKGVSDTQRYKLLGAGWTVDVIAHIFDNLPVKRNL